LKNDLNIQDDSSDSEDADNSCFLWALGGCFLTTIGTAVTGATIFADDANPHETSLKLAVGIVMLTAGAVFCGAGICLARYGFFPSKDIASNRNRSEDVNENTPFVGIDQRM